MSDLISRQAAIEALDVLCQEHGYKILGKIETYSQYNEAWQDALDRAERAIFNLPSAQPERKTEDFEKGLHDMFDHIWNCEIEHPMFEDTVGELMQAVIQLYRRVVQPCEAGEQDGNQEEGS